MVGGGEATGDTQLLFLGMGGDNPTSNPTLTNPAQTPPQKIDIWGGGLGRIQGRIRIGVILWSFLVILPPILP